MLIYHENIAQCHAIFENVNAAFQFSLDAIPSWSVSPLSVSISNANQLLERKPWNFSISQFMHKHFICLFFILNRIHRAE